MVDAHVSGHSQRILVGTDIGEEPVLFLQILDQLEDSLMIPLSRSVLITIGDDGHQGILLLIDISPQVGDRVAHCIIERSIGCRLIILLLEVGHLRNGHTVIDCGNVFAVEHDQTEHLFLIGIFFLSRTDGLNGFHYTSDGFVSDAVHGARGVQNDKVVDFLIHVVDCF